MNRKQRRRLGKNRKSAGKADLTGRSAAALLKEAVHRQRQGFPGDALDICRRVLAADPNHLDALNLGGVLELELGNGEAAFGLLREAVGQKPDFVRARENLGTASVATGRFEDAARAFRDVLAVEPENPRVQSNLGNVLSRLGEAEEALEAYGRALEIEPDSVPVLSNLAILKAETGEKEGALALYRRILDLDPADAEAYHDLSLVKTFRPGDADLAAMEKLRAAAPGGDEDAMFLDFALAKARDDAGDYDGAFRSMSAANAVKRASFDYDVSDEEEMVDRIIGVFGKSFLADRGGEGSGGGRPIFIVGMPRSGTTLVEQILASHSQVVGAGEVNHFRDAALGHAGAGPGVRGMSGQGRGFPEGVADLGPGDFRRLGDAYWDLLGRNAKGAPGAQLITDKMPRNFFFIGLIHLALADASIVHCLRNPVDTCLSCYQIHFPHGQEFAYDLGELGRHYRLYARLMDHWRAVLPGRILDLGYEDLVAEPEARMRELVDFCGLEWEDACLEFHKTGRQVRTASAQQVREPVYKTAVGRWRNYEAHLAPLLEALGPLAGGG